MVHLEPAIFTAKCLAAFPGKIPQRREILRPGACINQIRQTVSHMGKKVPAAPLQPQKPVSAKGLHESLRRGLPKPFRGFTDSFREFPEPFRGFTDSFRGLPDSFRGVPHSFRGFPQPFREFPASFRGFPGSFREVPASFRGFPDSFREGFSRSSRGRAGRRGALPWRGGSRRIWRGRRPCPDLPFPVSP